MNPEERFEPISWVREPGDPVPVCPLCGGLCKRLVSDDPLDTEVRWVCDLHKRVEPDWIDPRESEDDER